jgi:bis(5'-nucleosidyl)-tetraphosphatase
MAFEKSVGAVVFRREKQKTFYLVLRRVPVVKRSKGYVAKGDYWDLPKGRMEKGETKLETIEREIEEETGIKKTKTIPGFASWTAFFYRAQGEEKKNRKKKKKGLNIFKVVVYFLLETKTKKVKLSQEHNAFKWLEFEKAMKTLTYKKTANILKKAHKHLIFDKWIKK